MANTNRNIKYRPRTSYKTHNVKVKGDKYTYDTWETAVYTYEKLRPIYNEGIRQYGRGRQRYQLLPAGQKTFSYLDKQIKMMAHRINTGIYEQTGGQFKNAFLQAINSHIEQYGAYYSDEVFALVDIFDRMHHTQFTAFYNSLSPSLRGILFDTSNYYNSNGDNATSFAGRTIEELVKFARNNPKVRQILEEVAEDYAIMI